MISDGERLHFGMSPRCRHDIGSETRYKFTINTYTNSTWSWKRRDSITRYCVSDIWPFRISIFEPLQKNQRGRGVNILGGGELSQTHSGRYIGGQSLRASAKTGFVVSGGVTGEKGQGPVAENT